MSERLIVLLDMFNGEASWTEWKHHFLNFTQVNGWDGNSHVQWFQVCLVGRVQRNIQCLSEESSFADTIKVLDEKFELSSTWSWYQAELQTRIKQSTEDWAEYADDLRPFSERGFPDMPECTGEHLALQLYYRRLHHPLVAFSIKQYVWQGGSSNYWNGDLLTT